MGGSGDGAAHRPPANSRAEAMRAARLRLGQFAFSRDALMVFVRTLDAIFELAAIVRELLGHFVGPPGTLRLNAGLTITVSPI